MNFAAGGPATSYEVLGPWAEADPVPLRGIAPRLPDLAGKTIGLFSNGKRAAHLTLGAVERELLDKYPGARTAWYTSSVLNSPEMLTEGRPRFEAWAGSVDAAVMSVAD